MVADYKLVLYGEYGVGKTCLTNRLLQKNFSIFCSSTIGASFMSWIPDDIENNSKKRINFGIWDTAGQERFSLLLPMYIRGSDAVLYCWDYNIKFNKASADRMYARAIEHSPNCHFYLVLTKIDMSTDEEIISIAAEEWVNANNLKGCFYTSSYTGDGVQNCFTSLAKKLIEDPPPKKEAIIVVNSEKNIKKKCC
jgi:Rab family protein